MNLFHCHVSLIVIFTVERKRISGVNKLKRGSTFLSQPSRFHKLDDVYSDTES